MKPLTTCLTLAAVPTAARCSRVLVEQALTQWHLPHLMDDAALITSELVTNAVQATGLTDGSPRWSQLTGLAVIWVRCTCFDTTVRVEVWDRSPTPPITRSPQSDDEDGRGLEIVEALAMRWDYFMHNGGKVVWAELPVYALAVTTQLPPERDPVVLARVREGLLRM